MDQLLHEIFGWLGYLQRGAVVAQLLVVALPVTAAVVLERNPWIGGATVSRELHSGWTYSNCSYVCSLLRPEIVRDLELPRHGLQVINILDDFGSTQLAKLLARELQTNAKPNATVSQLRDQLLHHLGFRIPGSYPGLSESLEEFRRRRTQLRTGRTAEVRENVRWAAVRLERCIRDLLRFMCLYLFGHGPEVHFKGLLSGAASKDFNKATMGTLFSCLEQLAKEIERSANSDTDGNDPPLKELQGPLSATRLAPKGLEGITKLRNDFTHFEKLGDHRDDAREAKWFFDRTIELLEHWLDADPPIYPTTIVVEEIRYDQWNRRTVKARTDHGHEEIIVCEDALTPGDTYFMYPLSNPLRVDPILIGFRPEE